MAYFHCGGEMDERWRSSSEKKNTHTNGHASTAPHADDGCSRRGRLWKGAGEERGKERKKEGGAPWWRRGKRCGDGGRKRLQEGMKRWRLARVVVHLYA